MDRKGVYSVAEAAAMAGVHPQTYCKKLRIGEATGVKVYPGEWSGTRWIIRAAVFDKWLAHEKGFDFNDNEREDAA